VVTVADESASATYNDPVLSRRLLTVFQNWLGADRTTVTKPTMGAEDFGLFGRVEPSIPTCIFWLGAVDAARFTARQRTGGPYPRFIQARSCP
jgi:hippurate hydrolase